jgi:hypothetical protein
MRTLGLMAGAGVVFATATFGFAQSQDLVPLGRAPLEAPECQRGASPTPGETTGGAPLSDQLSQSKGIICPRPELTLA